MAAKGTEVRPFRVRPFKWQFDLFHNRQQQYVMLSVRDNGPVTVTNATKFQGPRYVVAVARSITNMCGDKIDVRCFGDEIICQLADSITQEFFPEAKPDDFRYEYNEQGNYSLWECRLPRRYRNVFCFHLSDNKIRGPKV